MLPTLLYLSEVTFCPVLGLKERAYSFVGWAGRGVEVPVVFVLLSAGEPQKDALPSPILERSDVLPMLGLKEQGS